ncbi:hypothetical protein ABK905_00575 [Acerihabitans sp. KWT182]|uniref:Uncharacterized protein n=1 Tax=Acerihabitans sp. KWT182 TaxID=3157919 RepID=A0AAU7Q9Z1_9GAMM
MSNKTTLNHPAVNYVNSVNTRIFSAADDFANESLFFISKDENNDYCMILTSLKKEDLEKLNPLKKFYTRSECNINLINRLITEMSREGTDAEWCGDKQQFDNSEEILMSACVMHFLGFNQHAKTLLKTAFKSETFMHSQLQFIYHASNVITKYKQKLRSSKPRNAYYEQAIKIIKNTWLKYPAASKAAMCSKLHTHFSGKISKDTLDRWIKKSKLQPPKPGKYIGFNLVIDEK